MLKVARVLPYQQRTPRTCSAASLHAILLHYGRDVSEELLSELIDVNHYGAELYQIVGAARALGFKAKQVQFEYQDEVVRAVRRGPIICDVQSWTKKGSGHYCVLVDINKGIAEVMDPNTEGNWRTMPYQEFDARWWDGDNVYRGRVLRRPGVVIEPRR